MFDMQDVLTQSIQEMLKLESSYQFSVNKVVKLAKEKYQTAIAHAKSVNDLLELKRKLLVELPLSPFRIMMGKAIDDRIDLLKISEETHEIPTNDSKLIDLARTITYSIVFNGDIKPDVPISVLVKDYSSYDPPVDSKFDSFSVKDILSLVHDINASVLSHLREVELAKTKA